MQYAIKPSPYYSQAKEFKHVAKEGVLVINFTLTTGLCNLESRIR